MKEKQKQKQSSEPLSREMLLRRNPVPFGDVRKYYYAGMIGTVVLLTVCFHISVVAVAIRTDACVQIPNSVILVILLFAGLNVFGHYSRTIAGYVLSMGMCMGIVLVMQFYDGGIALRSNLPEYGEVFQNAAKSTDFWILLVKVISVIHLFLSIIFVKSTLTIKEEPPLTGISIKLREIGDWLTRKGHPQSPGYRPLDYWVVAIELVLWMLMAASNVWETGKYDYWAMGLLLLGGGLIVLQQTLPGAFLLVASFLIQCTMYQYRFGLRLPVIVSYLGVWVAFPYFVAESYRGRKKEAQESGVLSFSLGQSVRMRIPLNDNCQKKSLWEQRWAVGLSLVAVAITVLTFPVHEILATFSGSYMVYQKDSLPLLFFLPLCMLVGMYNKSLVGRGCSIVSAFWFLDALLHSSPYKNEVLFLFNSIEQHGAIGSLTSERLNRLVKIIAVTDILFVVSVFIVSIIQARRVYRATQ